MSGTILRLDFADCFANMLLHRSNVSFAASSALFDFLDEKFELQMREKSCRIEFQHQCQFEE